MNLRVLDLDTLRTLVAAHELDGFAQAAARLGRTPSAVSLQMKRLQEVVGASLFRKEGRGVALTEAGEIALSYARRMLALNDELLHTLRGASLTGSVRLGCSQDFADTVLPLVLSQFVKLYPLVMLEVRIEGNAALADAVAKRELDLAVAVGQQNRSSAQVLGNLPLVWIAGAEFKRRHDQPLPLVVLGPQCAFRKEIIAVLDAADIAWRIAAVSPSLAGLWASARGGLGLTVRTPLGVPPDLVWNPRLFDLPQLPSFPITLHTAGGDIAESVARLRAIVMSTVAATCTPTEGS